MRLSDTEWTAMQALWEDAPATAREVHGRVVGATEWSYSTLRTILRRLEEKGAVASTMRGQQALYEPQVTREVARRSALTSLVDRAFGGRLGSLVQHLAGDASLSAAEREELARMLAGEDRGDAS